MGMFEKWSTLDPKVFCVIPFQKLVFLVSVYPEFWEKKNKEIKISWILVNSYCFCFTHANLMLDEKKKRLEFLFITPLLLLMNMSISLFRWTVQLIKTPKFFITKTTKLCSIILVSKIIEFYRYNVNEKSNTSVFSALFSNRYKFINQWKYREVNIRWNNEKDKKPLKLGSQRAINSDSVAKLAINQNLSPKWR